MNPDLMPGDICKWYPGESDYPSLVELIQPTEDGGWYVNYLNEPIDEDWKVDNADLVLYAKFPDFFPRGR